MATYDYASDGGNNYPVEPGQIWRAGECIIACGDLESGHAEALFERFGVPYLTVTDTPWNAGNARSFRTKAEPFTGVTSRPVDFEAFLRRIVLLARRCIGGAFFEMGVAQLPLLERLIIESGGDVQAVWDITYYRKHPCKWVRMPGPINPYLTEEAIAAVRKSMPSRADIEAKYAPQFAGKDDTEVVEPAINWFSERPSEVEEMSLVFDPCTGRGLMAETAHKLGRRFLGLELHPKRVSVTLTKLAACGLTPETAGTL